MNASNDTYFSSVQVWKQVEKLILKPTDILHLNRSSSLDSKECLKRTNAQEWCFLHAPRVSHKCSPTSCRLRWMLSQRRCQRPHCYSFIFFSCCCSHTHCIPKYIQIIDFLKWDGRKNSDWNCKSHKTVNCRQQQQQPTGDHAISNSFLKPCNTA